MSTSDKKIVNKPSKDLIEKWIFEKGLRIAEVIPVKKQDRLVVFLNNKKHVSISLSSFARLKKATQQQLDGWKLISKGVGIEWPAIDEDLSLKGLIQQFMLENTLKFIGDKNIGDVNFALAA